MTPPFDSIELFRAHHFVISFVLIFFVFLPALAAAACLFSLCVKIVRWAFPCPPPAATSGCTSPSFWIRSPCAPLEFHARSVTVFEAARTSEGAPQRGEVDGREAMNPACGPDGNHGSNDFSIAARPLEKRDDPAI